MPQQQQSAQQTVTRNALGLFSHPNRYGLPPGALFKAENCVIDREGVVSKRRGFDRYGGALTNVPSGLFEFDTTLVVLDGSTLKYDSDGAGTWSSWTGSFSVPDANTDMTALEANLNFYFTTDAGVYVNDALTNNPVRAGTPQGLDVQLAKVGTGNGFFTVDSQVGYRLTWLRKDDNENEKRGAPSFQETIANSWSTGLAYTVAGGGPYTITVTHTGHGYSDSDVIEIANDSNVTITDGAYTITYINANSYSFSFAVSPGGPGTLDAGKDHDVQLTSTIPDDIVAGDTYELYRTNVSASASTHPGDRHFLIKTGEVVAGDITNGYIQVTDDQDEAFLGADLYTNDTEEGLVQANDRPPWCRYMATFEGHTFYANAKREPYRQIQFLDVAGLVDDTSSVTVTVGGSTETYTFSTAEDLGNKKFQRYTSGSTTAENVEDTMKSFCKVVNRESTLVYAYYTSGVDDAPGYVLIKKRTLNSTAFSLTCDASGTGDNFSPELPTSGTTVSSSEDEEKNVLYRSKYHQPEAVPALNKHKVGRANRAILGVAGSKEALIVFKEDGVYIISGESDGSAGATLATNELDPTIRISAAGSLVLLDNSAVCFTDQGVMRFTPAGSGILSRQIEADFSKISKYSNFATITRAVGYESDRKYLVFLQESGADARAKIVWCYNYLTNAWTTWKKDVRGGLVKSDDQLLYLMHNVDKYILQERKSYSTAGDDAKDEELDCTISAASGTSITITGWTYGTDPAEGWRIKQGANATNITAVTSSGGGTFVLTVVSAAGFGAGAGTIEMGIAMEIEWAPESAGSPSTLKRFAICSVFPEIDGGTHKLGFRADMQDDFEWLNNVTTTRTRGWGTSPWGSPWGDEQAGKLTAIRTYLPRDHQICRSLSVKFKNVYAKQDVHVLQLALDVSILSTRVERG